MVNFIEKAVEKLSGEPYYKEWKTVYADGSIITDEEIAKFVKEHSRLIDRLNPAKFTFMINIAYDMCRGRMKIPNGKWRFK